MLDLVIEGGRLPLLSRVESDQLLEGRAPPVLAQHHHAMVMLTQCGVSEAAIVRLRTVDRKQPASVLSNPPRRMQDHRPTSCPILAGFVGVHPDIPFDPGFTGDTLGHAACHEREDDESMGRRHLMEFHEPAQLVVM